MVDSQILPFFKVKLVSQYAKCQNQRLYFAPVDDLIAKLSEYMTLECGDVIVTGTPAGVGYVRKTPVYMKGEDVCEVEIERIGLLSNSVLDEDK
jgi:2-keto-4-pentenoate hydratase/2-oxohepta-3-ene-1,7-dioic acid hydratase in catechol pathway